MRDTIYYIDLRAGEMFSFEEIYHDKTYEQENSFIPQAGWIVFDVGANAGVFTVQQAQRRATVYAFEPNPACLGRLRKNVTVNALNDRVKVLDVALGSAVGQGTLVMSDGVTCIGAVLPTETAPSNEGTAIQISSLDDITAALNVERIDLLKIDTEGAELEVLRGAQKTLQNVEHVVLEYHSAALLNQTIDLLHDHGFSLVRRHVPDASAERGVIYLDRPGLGGNG